MEIIQKFCETIFFEAGIDQMSPTEREAMTQKISHEILHRFIGYAFAEMDEEQIRKYHELLITDPHIAPESIMRLVKTDLKNYENLLTNIFAGFHIEFLEHVHTIDEANYYLAEL